MTDGPYLEFNIMVKNMFVMNQFKNWFESWIESSMIGESLLNKKLWIFYLRIKNDLRIIVDLRINFESNHFKRRIPINFLSLFLQNNSNEIRIIDSDSWQALE